MANGQIVYVSGIVSQNQEIYNGESAQRWPMSVESGSFPAGQYRVTKATLKLDIINVYGANKHILVTRENGEGLGDVPVTATGAQEHSLLLAPSYAGITSIVTDGVEAWPCQLRGGSCIRILIEWEETQPVTTQALLPQPVSVTGAKMTGTKGNALHAEVSVAFDGVDISGAVSDDLLSLVYTDNEEDEADDLQIKLQDRAKKWLGHWLNDTLSQAANGTKSIVAVMSAIVKVVTGFMNSLEFLAIGVSNPDVVEMLYNVMLNRGSDEAGKESWVAILNSGTSVAAVIDGFAGSPEFKNLWTFTPCSPIPFVTKCYNVILGRDPDEPGLTFWTGIMKEDTKGLTISAGVKQYLPDGQILSTNFGFFELDNIKSSGPPSNINVKGTSLPYSGGIRTEERDKSWEGYTLSRIGEEIATNGGLGFMYDCPDDPTYERVEQAKQTDIAFLQQLCHDNGKSLKIFGLQLIIFDQARYEALEPITTIRWMDGTYTKYDLSTSSGDTHYDMCTVSYFDADTGITYQGTAYDDEYDEEAKEYTVCTITNRKVASAEEAAELASRLLRLHNKYEKKVSFTLVGNPILGAGLTVTLKGFGLWDEKYIIKQCRHEISNTGGYTTKITLRTIPDGKVETVDAEAQAKEEESSGGGGSSGNKKGTYKNVDKAWFTETNVTVYNGKDGGSGVNMIQGDQKIQILSNTDGKRTLVSCNGVTGWVNTTQIKKKEDKSAGGNKGGKGGKGNGKND